MAGFEFAYRLSGAAPTIQPVIVKVTALKKGDMVNLETGQADLAVTTDVNFIGVALATKAGMTIGTTTMDCVTDDDAVYRVVDANARVMGATLDIAGATGAQGVAASSNKEFVVMADSGSDEPTLVRFNTGKHFKNKAQ